MPKHTRSSRWLALGLLLALWPTLLGLAPSRAATGGAPPDTVYALTASGLLARFASNTPGTFNLLVPIIGLGGGESLVAMDFRPKTGQLYGVSVSGTNGSGHGLLYTINISTGVATRVSSTPFSTSLTVTVAFDMDFNPVVDRIRLVNTAGQNLRINPNNGTLAGLDSNLHCDTPPCYIVGIAYDRNQTGATATTVYGLDWFSKSLVTIGTVNGATSPNTGLITNTKPLGLVIASTLVGFDIAPSGVAYASLEPGSQFRFYVVNLATGAATLVGNLSNGTIPIIDIAVPARFRTYLPLTRK